MSKELEQKAREIAHKVWREAYGFELPSEITDTVIEETMAYKAALEALQLKQKELDEWDGENEAAWKMVEALKERCERLEKSLHSIALNTCCDTCQEAALVARQALTETKGSVTQTTIQPKIEEPTGISEKVKNGIDRAITETKGGEV